MDFRSPERGRDRSKAEAAGTPVFQCESWFPIPVDPKNRPVFQKPDWVSQLPGGDRGSPGGSSYKKARGSVKKAFEFFGPHGRRPVSWGPAGPGRGPPALDAPNEGKVPNKIRGSDRPPIRNPGGKSAHLACFASGGGWGGQRAGGGAAPEPSIFRSIAPEFQNVHLPAEQSPGEWGRAGPMAPNNGGKENPGGNPGRNPPLRTCKAGCARGTLGGGLFPPAGMFMITARPPLGPPMNNRAISGPKKAASGRGGHLHTGGWVQTGQASGQSAKLIRPRLGTPKGGPNSVPRAVRRPFEGGDRLGRDEIRACQTPFDCNQISGSSYGPARPDPAEHPSGAQGSVSIIPSPGFCGTFPPASQNPNELARGCFPARPAFGLKQGAKGRI